MSETTSDTSDFETDLAASWDLVSDNFVGRDQIWEWAAREAAFAQTAVHCSLVRLLPSFELRDAIVAWLA